jgi:hypothetical protein
MTSSTFSFNTAQANPNHATPHGGRRTASSSISLRLEQPLQPVAPASRPWSNVQDLARYLITQMSQGVAPDGTRMVSADNLKLTRQPQVERPQPVVRPGWGGGLQRGTPAQSHGGTNGFTSNLTFLPNANLGVAILSNAQDNNIFIAAVLTRMLELAYGLPMEADAGLAKRSAEAKQALRDQLAKLPPDLDRDAVAPYQGVYTNSSLGEVTLALQDEKFVLDAGTFNTELHSAGNGTYLIWDPPLVGLLVKRTRMRAGQHAGGSLGSPTQPGIYSFTQKPPWAVPGEVITWIRDSAHPLNTTSPDDPLTTGASKEIVGDAEIIGLGEATHGSSEFFSRKHRLVKYLVEELGYTTFVPETDGPIGLALDEYVLNGTGDPKAILDFPWRTQEVLDLIEWMRLYNADPQHEHKVRI